MRLGRVLVVIVLFVVLVLLALPLAGKWYLTQWFEKRGFEAVVKQVSFNYLFGRVTMGGISLQREGIEHLSVFALELDMQLADLFSGQLTFDKIVTDNLRFTLAREAQGWRVGGMIIDDWLPAGDAGVTVVVKRLESVNTDMCTRDGNQCLRIEDLAVGSLAGNHQAEQWSFSHLAPLYVTKIFLQDRVDSTSVLYMDGLEIDQSEFSEQATSVQGLGISNFQLIENRKLPGGRSFAAYQTQIGELEVGSLQLQFGERPGIRVADVKLISYRQAIARQAPGVSTWYNRAENWFPETTRLWRGVDFASKTGTAFALKNFFLQGGRFTWRDNTVAPPAIETMSQIKLTIDNIDSDSSQRSQLAFDAKLGDIGALRFDSTAQFFAGSPLFDVNGFAHGVDLADFAGYSAEIFGQRVKAGVIDMSFNAGVAGGHVAGQSVWRITGLATEAVDAPLNKAFKKLADHNNSVEFELPIGLSVGEGAEPVQALGRAVANTLVNKARTVSAKTGNVMVERKVAQQTLPAIFFANNDERPAELDLQRLPSIAARLKASSKATLVVCPVASGGEWASLYNGGRLPSEAQQPSAQQRKALLDLTARRGQLLSRMLMNEGVAAARIIVCGPSMDMTKSGPSMATLAI